MFWDYLNFFIYMNNVATHQLIRQLHHRVRPYLSPLLNWRVREDLGLEDLGHRNGDFVDDLL